MSSKLIRWGGPAAVLGGILFAAVFALINLMIYGLKVIRGAFLESHAFSHMLDAPMYLLLVVGVLALYLRQKERFGRLGKAGFYLTFGGFTLAAIGGLAIIVVGLSVGEEATLGVLDVLAHPLSMLQYSVGSVLFGIATFQANVLPRAGALLLTVGGPLWFFGPAFFSSLINGSENWLLVLPAMVPAVLFGGGWALLGYALLSEKGERAAHLHPYSRIERKGTGDA
jgi:hypothetical protein